MTDGKDAEKLSLSYIAGGSEKGYESLWKMVWQFFKN